MQNTGLNHGGKMRAKGPQVFRKTAGSLILWVGEVFLKTGPVCSFTLSEWPLQVFEFKTPAVRHPQHFVVPSAGLAPPSVSPTRV